MYRARPTQILLTEPTQEHFEKEPPLQTHMTMITFTAVPTKAFGQVSRFHRSFAACLKQKANRLKKKPKCKHGYMASKISQGGTTHFVRGYAD